MGLACFRASPLSCPNWNLEMLVFSGKRKTVELGEKPWEQGENQQQTQPINRHRSGVELRPH